MRPDDLLEATVHPSNKFGTKKYKRKQPDSAKWDAYLKEAKFRDPRYILESLHSTKEKKPRKAAEKKIDKLRRSFSTQMGAKTPARVQRSRSDPGVVHIAAAQPTFTKVQKSLPKKAILVVHNCYGRPVSVPDIKIPKKKEQGTGGTGGTGGTDGLRKPMNEG